MRQGRLSGQGFDNGFGTRSITLSRTNAGLRGERSPRSQCRKVAAETPKETSR